ncbi:MAG: hypothetical protein V4608_10860 [Bacteroidota bacterium]
MTELEYNEKLKIIETNYELAKKAVYLAYGMGQAKFKVGDIIKDHRWILLIDKITVSKSFGLPDPVYSGAELKKDLTLRKDGNRVSIYGNNCELLQTVNPSLLTLKDKEQ